MQVELQCTCRLQSSRPRTLGLTAICVVFLLFVRQVVCHRQGLQVLADAPQPLRTARNPPEGGEPWRNPSPSRLCQSMLPRLTVPEDSRPSPFHRWSCEFQQWYCELCKAWSNSGCHETGNRHKTRIQRPMDYISQQEVADLRRIEHTELQKAQADRDSFNMYLSAFTANQGPNVTYDEPPPPPPVPAGGFAAGRPEPPPPVPGVNINVQGQVLLALPPAPPGVRGGSHGSSPGPLAGPSSTDRPAAPAGSYAGGMEPSASSAFGGSASVATHARASFDAPLAPWVWQ